LAVALARTLVLAVLFTQCEGIPVAEALSPAELSTATAAVLFTKSLEETEALESPQDTAPGLSFMVATTVGSAALITVPPKSQQQQASQTKRLKDLAASIFRTIWSWICAVFNAVYGYVKSSRIGHAVSEMANAVRSRSTGHVISDVVKVVSWAGTGLVSLFTSGVRKVAICAVYFFELIGWIDASNTNWYWNSKWWKDFFSDNTVQANVVSLANFVVLIQTGITIIESVTLCVNTVLTPVYKLVDLVSSMWNTTPVTKGKHTNDHKEQTCMQKKQRKEKRRRKVCKRKGKTCKRKQKGSKKKQEASNNTTPTSEGWITTLVKMLLDALWYIIMAFLVVVFYILSKGLTEFCKMGKRILKGVRNATKTSLSWVCNVAVPGVWRHVCIMGRYVLNRVDEYKQALEAQRRQAEQETQRRQAEAEEAARLLEAQRRQAEQETQRRQAEAEEAARLLHAA